MEKLKKDLIDELLREALEFVQSSDLSLNERTAFVEGVEATAKKVLSEDGKSVLSSTHFYNGVRYALNRLKEKDVQFVDYD